VRAAPGPAALKDVQVVLIASEPVWVSASADGRPIFQGELQVNDTRTVEASREVLLKLGNAGGVNVVMNGRAIGPMGPKGQVRAVRIRAAGFEIIDTKPDVPPNPAVGSAAAPSAVTPQHIFTAGSTKVNPKDGLTYVWIPPGTFLMGCSPGDGECFSDERPAHEVTITRGFWLGQTPVTQQAYQRVTGQNPSHFWGANLPVENVNWDEARAYCMMIGGRLPTEAEWEYAARAGSTGARYGNLDDIAWYSGYQPRGVGQKQANAFGLYDMLGNVWQWTADWYGDYQSGAQSDPSGPPGGTLRALRGGSWSSNPRVVRISFRYGFEPDYRVNYIGLRCVGE
jgi:formylglycine-generating enzyme required for sulfatase activity